MDHTRPCYYTMKGESSCFFWKKIVLQVPICTFRMCQKTNIKLRQSIAPFSSYFRKQAPQVQCPPAGLEIAVWGETEIVKRHGILPHRWRQREENGWLEALGRFAIKISPGPDDGIRIRLVLLIQARKPWAFVEDSPSDPEWGTKEEVKIERKGGQMGSPLVMVYSDKRRLKLENPWDNENRISISISISTQW